MPSLESRPSFIDNARRFLGFERGKSRWEHLGAGLKLAAAAEGAWAVTDFITGHPLEGSIKALSAIGVGLVGHMLHDRHNQFTGFRNPEMARLVIAALAIPNLAITAIIHYLIQESFSPVAIITSVPPLMFTVILTELERRDLRSTLSHS